MAVTALRPKPKFQEFDLNGDPLAGGKLYTYSAGTTTALATYTDSTGTVANANPVILDSRGEASVWFLFRDYKLVLKDSNDNTIWTQDNFSGSSFDITGPLDELKGDDIASAATIDLSIASGNFVHITGTTSITGITLDVGAERTVVFDGILTLTHNAASLMLPGGQNIVTAAGDRAIIRGESIGNVRVIDYIRASSAIQNQAKGADIASAATVSLDAATGDFVHITGTTTITAITLASGKEATVVFDGALTLTHNATTLILPGAANITTAAGDRATFRGDGSGNVRCIHYTKASGLAVVVAGTSVGDHEVVVTTGNGHGSTNNKIRRFTTTQSSVGTAVTYADSAANGSSFTINDTGLYSIYYAETNATDYSSYGVSVNSAQLTTSISSITDANRLMISRNSYNGVTGFPVGVSRVVKLTAGDVVRPHTDGLAATSSAVNTVFAIRKVGT